MARELSQAELNDLLRGADRAQAKPTAVTPAVVGGQVLQALAAGAGMAALTAGLLAATGAPWEPLAQWSLTAGVIVAGAGLLLRAVPADRILSAQRLHQVQATVTAAEFRKRKAYEAITELEGRIGELQRALDRMTQERDAAVLAKKSAVDQLQAATTRNFVRASNTEARVVSDAHEMLRHWFSSGETKWFSRATANDFGWSDKRHKAAQQLLVDSGVVVINEKRPRVMVRPVDLAIRTVNDHVAKVDSVYMPEAPARAWELDEE